MSLNYLRFEDLLYKKAVLNGIPLAGEFELTARCNFSCKMCFVDNHSGNTDLSAKEYSASEWLKLTEAARDCGMLYLTLTGGEVLMRRDFMEIYTEASRMGLIINVFTNASMVTKEIAQSFARIPPKIIEITLYGASSETYGKVCGHPEGFEKVKKGIEMLLAEGLDINLKTTLIRDNVSDYDEIFDLADKYGLGLKHVKYISPRRDECENLVSGCRLSPEKQAEINTYASKRFDERQRKIKSTNDGKKPLAFEGSREFEGSGQFEGLDDGYPFRCASGRCSFWMTWDGRMTPCVLMAEPAFKPFEIGFKEAWNNLRESSRSIPVCRQCAECSIKEFCFRCPARLKNETGCFDKPAPYLCEMAKSLSKQ